MARFLPAVLVLVAALLALGCAARAQQQPERPNILFVMTDDQDAASLEYMPYVNNLIKNQGTTFENAHFSYPLCCPSRATMLTGLYAHNHGVTSNLAPEGGEPKFRDLTLDKDTVATRLDAVGYETAYFGKYLNGYKGLYVPPGWDRWFTRIGSRGDLTFNSDGRQVSRASYETTDAVVAYSANRYLKEQTPAEKPFFAYVSFNSPHFPANHESRYDGLFDKVGLPDSPSFNERDVSDKPAYVQEKALLTGEKTTRLEEYNEDRLRSLQTVDKSVRALMATLRDSGELNNTLVIFWTDNGSLLGQHRLAGKTVPYDEAARFPLLVRGPNVPEGAVEDALVSNTDIAPTFEDYAGAETASVDGRPLAPLLEDPSSPGRDAVLLEGWAKGGVPGYQAVRTREHLYVEYDTGERELYDMVADPYQQENYYATADPARISELERKLDALRDCAGDSCRRAEGG